MMERVLTQLSDLLLIPRQPPCISIYLPTHRHYPGIVEDPIRFKNRLREVEEQLKRQYPQSESRELMAKLESVPGDESFWNHQWDGLAIFCSKDYLKVMQLQRTVEDLGIVADTFHVKPLIRIWQTADRYQVLALSQGDVAIYEGDRYQIDKIPLRNVPGSIQEVLGAELSVGAASGKGRPQSQDELMGNLMQFFRIVDKSVWENHTRLSGLPLILAAVEYYHPLFHQISKNPNLTKEGIKLDPMRIAPELLRQEAWRIMEPHYHQEVAHKRDQYQAAKVRQIGSDEPTDVATAALRGRVDSVLVDANRKIGGKVNKETGHLELGPITEAGYEDILDEIAEAVLKTEGNVYVVPPDQMPSATGVAAIYRY